MTALIEVVPPVPRGDDACWLRGPEPCPLPHPRGGPGASPPSCLTCPLLQEELAQSRGGGEALAGLLSAAVEEIDALRGRVGELTERHAVRERERQRLRSLRSMFQGSADREEVIVRALVAITSGKGFGLNRAVFLLVDGGRAELRGHFAVGPRTPGEAARIWEEIRQQDQTLEDLARLLFERQREAERAKFQDLLEALSIPLGRREHPFVRALAEGRASQRDLGEEFRTQPAPLEALGAGPWVLIPLLAESGPLGLIVADNCVSHRRLTPEELEALEAFTLPLCLALERAAAFERLREELGRATRAAHRMEAEREHLLRRERVVVADRITTEVAHTVRNPLTVIGGFARRFAEDVSPADPLRPTAEAVAREARRLEGELRVLLDEVGALYPPVDYWDLNHLLVSVCADLRREASAPISLGSLEEDLPLAWVDFRTAATAVRTLLQRERGSDTGLTTASEGGHVVVTVTSRGPDPRDDPWCLGSLERAMRSQGGELRAHREGGLRRYHLVFPREPTSR